MPERLVNPERILDIDRVKVKNKIILSSLYVHLFLVGFALSLDTRLSDALTVYMYTCIY